MWRSVLNKDRNKWTFCMLQAFIQTKKINFKLPCFDFWRYYCHRILPRRVVTLIQNYISYQSRGKFFTSWLSMCSSGIFKYKDQIQKLHRDSPKRSNADTGSSFLCRTSFNIWGMKIITSTSLTSWRQFSAVQSTNLRPFFEVSPTYALTTTLLPQWASI